MSYAPAKWGTKLLQYNPESVEYFGPAGHVVRSDVGGAPTFALLGDATEMLQFRTWLAGADAKTTWDTIQSQFKRRDFIVLVLDWPGSLYVVPQHLQASEKLGSAYGDFLYQFLIRADIIGTTTDYKRASDFDYNLYSNDFSLDGQVLIPMPYGSTSHSQTATITRKGEAGNIPCVYATKPVLTYTLSEENRVLGNLTVTKSGQEKIIDTQTLKVQTREDEATYKGRIDLSYWDGSAWQAVGMMGFQALAAGGAYESTDSLMPQSDILFYDDECCLFKMNCPTTDTYQYEYGVYMLFYRGKPFFYVLPKNYGPTLTGFETDFYTSLTTLDEFYAVGEWHAVASGNHALDGSAASVNYHYLTTDQAPVAATIQAGFLRAEKSNQYCMATDGTTHWDAIGNRWATIDVDANYKVDPCWFYLARYDVDASLGIDDASNEVIAEPIIGRTLLKVT